MARPMRVELGFFALLQKMSAMGGHYAFERVCSQFSFCEDMKQGFSDSAQAMLLSGILSLFLCETHWTELLLPSSSLWTWVSKTFTITDPSLRWMFTFLPRNDFAVLALNLSILGHHSTSMSDSCVQHLRQIGILSPLSRM